MQFDHALPFAFSKPIATERLTLRLMSLADVDDIVSYQSREDVCRYLLFGPRTRDEVEERVAKHAASSTLEKDGDYLQLALELPATDDAPARVIGDSYFTISNLENSRGEIGWTLHPDFAGHGYAAEAARAVLDVAFGQIGLHRIYAELDPRNDASIALCKRLGMREEAFFVKDLWFKGEWGDTGIYAILREEWLAANA
ncbi:MAG TPA: GNAT family protein [Galbitalea sp.]|jgi:RimJ/RimL family protein N-acetyltransferase|nr:GNAT family protein [Galbitalea sp.]